MSVPGRNSRDRSGGLASHRFRGSLWPRGSEMWQRVERLWRETLRYRKNHAYLYEVRQIREAVEWLLVNSYML